MDNNLGSAAKPGTDGDLELGEDRLGVDIEWDTTNCDERLAIVHGTVVLEIKERGFRSGERDLALFPGEKQDQGKKGEKTRESKDGVPRNLTEHPKL
jgi:hypothetical protein